MINFKNIEKSEPYELFKTFFEKVLKTNQKNPDAICLSTYNTKTNEVSSRFVNLKYVIDNKWYFFSNYNSQKAEDIKKNNQASIVIFWPEIFTQIRLKAKIFLASPSESESHFNKRSLEKNALAISSNQSRKIKNYETVRENYQNTLSNLKRKESYDRPDYWGGYFFEPYYFEFWEGHKDRINKRTVFEFSNNDWKKYFLEP